MAIYFEDLEVGAKERFGSYEVSREEVLDFAAKYDPQPFHLDDEAASHSIFGKIAASGWHTCGMMMNMLVRHWQEIGLDQASLGGAGMDELRWTRPVYPGDVLHCTAELLEKTPSRSKADRGMTRTRLVVFNHNDEPVMSVVAIGMIRRRPAPA
jgi:acyl dehydratase